MTFIDHICILLVSLKITQYNYNKTNTYQIIISLSVNMYLKTLMQRNNKGIIGNDIRMPCIAVPFML